MMSLVNQSCEPRPLSLSPIKTDAVSIYHSSWHGLLAKVDVCDAVIVDAPYSDQTHTNRAWALKKDRNLSRAAGDPYAQAKRRTLNYEPWSKQDVSNFVDAWTKKCAGWFVTITDHILAPHWSASMTANGLYTFAPIPFVAPGSRVRLSGDGPSNWACWIVVGRPRTKCYSRWRALPGAYVLPRGQSERYAVAGGKPKWLLERLIEDYSRPGDLIVDPCCGGGTSLVAAMRTGRRIIASDVMLEHAKLSVEAVNREAMAHEHS